MPNSGSKFVLPPHPLIKDYYADEAGRVKRVNALFDSSARDYDLINRIMSLGTGERYRYDALVRAGLGAGQSVLDIGCGTGVIARYEMDLVGPDGMVVGIDPSKGMLVQAVTRGVAHVAQGYGERLPLKDRSVDFISMGYALRHVSDLVATFKEYWRVLKPEGKLLLLEIAPPASWWGYRLTKVYMKYLIPLATWLGTRNRDAQTLMSYYWESIDQCVPPRLILEALTEVGFEQAHRNVLMGVFGEYTALRPSIPSRAP